jgi:hypothetical protein
MDLDDLGVLENGRVEVHRVFGIIGEPEERSDLLHNGFLFQVCMKKYHETGALVENHRLLTVVGSSHP